MSLLVEAAASWIAEGRPTAWPSASMRAEGVEAVMIESVPFEGRPTRVFAWLGVPEGASGDRPVPGVVLVHGGGGTAFDRWVRWWNARGYAAIAMDCCGCLPTQTTSSLPSEWARHGHGGPAGWGGFEQAERPAEDQWCYHAPAAVIKAHALLAARDQVDANRIGLTGVSWGGYLTCLVAGLDPRLKAAAPVYGCGYVADESTWTHQGSFDNLTPQQATFWRDHFDPARVLHRADMPMLWLNGTNDFAYWPSAWQRSIDTAPGPHQQCMKLRWPHGHIPEAENARELAAFFDAHLADGKPMLRVDTPTLEADTLRAAYEHEAPPRAATLVITPDRGTWPTREWHTLPATIAPTTCTVSATVPAGVTAAFLSLTSDDWLTTTSAIQFFQ